MKILNLVYPEKSDIQYRIDKFPDGQQNITLTNLKEFFDIGSQYEFGDPLEFTGVTIKARLNNFKDLELICCAVASLKECWGFNSINLYIPYIMGARSDRKFEEGGNNYLKDVICPILNSLELDSITCIDPHSDILEACLKNFRKLDNLDLVRWWQRLPPNGNVNLDNIVLVSPDAGASKKIYKIAEKIGYNGDIVTCSKNRDNEGKLTKTIVPIDSLHLNKDFVIIDDIFDFGGTFKNIAKVINDKGCKGKKYLIVTHSIQTEGLIDALNYFDCIYATNSYKDHNLENIKQLNVF